MQKKNQNTRKKLKKKTEREETFRKSQNPKKFQTENESVDKSHTKKVECVQKIIKKKSLDVAQIKKADKKSQTNLKFQKTPKKIRTFKNSQKKIMN